MNANDLTFFHAPNSRSGSARVLLEELGAPYRLHALDLKTNEQRGAAYLAINPMGKVPAIRHGDALVTEQAAVYMYLADLFPDAALAPAVRDPLRGPYLRWFVFYGSCFEPAIVDRAMKREPASAAMNPYGDFDTMLDTVTAQLRTGPWMLGERFTALDVLWGGGLSWILRFGLIPERPEFRAYVERVTSRPAWTRATEADAALAAEQEKAAAAA